MNNFKVGDIVRIIANPIRPYQANYSYKTIGEEFKIGEITGCNQWIREHEGVQTGIHYELLELVSSNQDINNPYLIY